MITIRNARPDDEEFIKAHAYRLLEFGPPAWRVQEHDQMTEADIRHILKALRSSDPDNPVFVAIDDSGNRCGFLHMIMDTDYYTGESHAHLTDIVVIPEAEGKGIGKFLLQKAEEWAVQKNSRWITLNAFVGNRHARTVYEKVGYQQEWIKYLKQLR